MKRFVTILWLSSLLGAGAAFWILSPQGRVVMWGVAIVLDTAHRVVPIVTAWSHPGFRNVMLQKPLKTLGLPLIILFAATGVGLATGLGWTSFTYVRGRQWILTDWTNPFPITLWIYSLWNTYHFGMQNFGVISLLRGRRSEWQRTCDMTWTFALTLAAWYTVPAAIPFNHWITELGLCARVSKRTIILLAVVLLFGATSLLFMVPTPLGPAIWYAPGIMMILISANLGLGMWHFLQDRWMWKLSDPQVRATIGKDLYTGLQQA